MKGRNYKPSLNEEVKRGLYEKEVFFEKEAFNNFKLNKKELVSYW